MAENEIFTRAYSEKINSAKSLTIARVSKTQQLLLNQLMAEWRSVLNIDLDCSILRIGEHLFTHSPFVYDVGNF